MVTECNLLPPDDKERIYFNNFNYIIIIIILLESH
jgi:hypothetical protein